MNDLESLYEMFRNKKTYLHKTMFGRGNLPIHPWTEEGFNSAWFDAKTSGFFMIY